MKVLILNSGTGTRLGELTKKTPKAMTEINGKTTILSRQIEILKEVGCTDFFITTGPFKEILKNYVTNLFLKLNVVYINNPEYKTTNYIYSLFLAKELLKNSDIVLLHGDLVFDKKVAEKVVGSKSSRVVVSTTESLPQDDFKAVISDSKIIKIGVNFFERAVACQPFYYLTQADWELWMSEIITFVENNDTGVYAENALNNITDRLTLFPLDIKNDLCREIDTIEDLAKVKKLLD